VLMRHGEIWNIPTTDTIYNNLIIKTTKMAIDTTFGMYRNGTYVRARPEPKGLRFDHPYSARHLDWYLDEKNMAVDQQIYANTASTISHWSLPKCRLVDGQYQPL
jgi:hypothetical protein